MAKRSIWKGPFIHKEIFSDISLNKKKIKTTARSTVILPFLIGKTLYVYNGKVFIPIIIIEEMVGSKLGEFIPTRLRHIYKKKNNKNLWVKKQIQIVFNCHRKQLSFLATRLIC